MQHRKQNTATPPTCPSCKRKARMMTGAALYPERPDLATVEIWHCWTCDTRVSAHKRSGEPMGTMAGQDLRWQRQCAHEAFDHLWKSGLMSRDSAYKWLAKRMDLAPEHCHIGMFTIQQCKTLISFSEILK